MKFTYFLSNHRLHLIHVFWMATGLYFYGIYFLDSKFFKLLSKRTQKLPNGWCRQVLDALYKFGAKEVWRKPLVNVPCNSHSRGPCYCVSNMYGISEVKYWKMQAFKWQKHCWKTLSSIAQLSVLSVGLLFKQLTKIFAWREPCYLELGLTKLRGLPEWWV